MKSLTTIKNQLRNGDYDLVATGLGVSRDLVVAVVHGYRKDHHRIAEAFEILFDSRGKNEAEVIEKLNGLRDQVAA
jgi:hypothetical protein